MGIGFGSQCPGRLAKDANISGKGDLVDEQDLAKNATLRQANTPIQEASCERIHLIRRGTSAMPLCMN